MQTGAKNHIFPGFLAGASSSAKGYLQKRGNFTRGLTPYWQTYSSYSSQNITSSTINTGTPPHKKVKQGIKEFNELLTLHKRSILTNKHPGNEAKTETEGEPNSKNQDIANLSSQFSEDILKNSSTFSFNTIKKCLIIMKKVSENSALQNSFKEELSILEKRFYFLHNNINLFEKEFPQSIRILDLFSALNHRLQNKEYLTKWCGFALKNLKFFTDQEISRITYISVFQLTGYMEIYNTVKLQLFRPTPLYYQEFMKVKFAVQPSQFGKVTDFIKSLFNKIVLSSYRRQGIYWQKDFSFSMSDTIRILQSYIDSKDDDKSYIRLIVSMLKENIEKLFQNDETTTQNQKYLDKLLPLISNLSEKDSTYIGEDYLYLSRILLSYAINEIPSSTIEELASFTTNINLITNRIPEDKLVQVYKSQILEALRIKLEAINEIPHSWISYNQIFLNLSKAYFVMSAHINDPVVNRHQNTYRELLKIYLAQIKETSLKDSSGTLITINQILRILDEEKEGYVIDFRTKVANSDFTNTKISELFALNYLSNLLSDSSSLADLSTKARANFEYFTNNLYENLEKESLTEDFCGLFFEIYCKIILNRVLLSNYNLPLEKIDQLRNSILRYFVDHFHEFSLKSIEKILMNCLLSGTIEVSFDDGSGLYDKTIVEELLVYIEKHISEFSPDFQSAIQPELLKHAKPGFIEGLTNKIL